MNPVVHWELFAPDALVLARFYEALFDWTPEPLPDIGYVHIDTNAGAGIYGGIASAPDGTRQPMFYVSADDLDSTLDQIHRAGGTTTLPPLHEVVTFAQFADPEGNIVGLVKSGDESTVSEGDKPAVSGFWLGTTDPDALVGFYREVFEWGVRPRSLADGTTCFEVETGAGGIPGAIGRRRPGGHAVMFRVTADAPGPWIERAQALGASVGPAEQADAAYIIDPAGQTLELLSSRQGGFP